MSLKDLLVKKNLLTYIFFSYDLKPIKQSALKKATPADDEIKPLRVNLFITIVIVPPCFNLFTSLRKIYEGYIQ